jgi:hypothetical protein
MAAPLSIKVVMKEGREEITLLGSGPPRINALETGTLEISAQTQGAPTTTQGINTMETAAASAPPPKIRLFLQETKPFNYAKVDKDEGPLLHILGCVEHTSDDALAGNERTGDKSDKDTAAETDRMSSEDSDLAEQIDLLLNGGMPLSHTQGNNHKTSLMMAARWLITKVKNRVIIAQVTMTDSQLICLSTLIIWNRMKQVGTNYLRHLSLGITVIER